MAYSMFDKLADSLYLLSGELWVAWTQHGTDVEDVSSSFGRMYDKRVSPREREKEWVL